MPARQPAAAAADEEAKAKDNVRWLFTNAQCADMRGHGGANKTDMQRLAESIVSCRGTQEGTTRIEYVAVMAADGRYRLYDARGNSMSNEKYGTLFAVLELKPAGAPELEGTRFFLYKENPVRPWPAE